MVGACPAAEVVVACPAPDVVGACPAPDVVGACPAADVLGACPAPDVLCALKLLKVLNFTSIPRGGCNLSVGGSSSESHVAASLKGSSIVAALMRGPELGSIEGKGKADVKIG